MTRAVFVALALVACADPPVDTPDAAPPDDPVCCAYLPNEDAARACVLDQPDAPPSGTCGVYLCPSDDGIHRINFCIP